MDILRARGFENMRASVFVCKSYMRSPRHTSFILSINYRSVTEVPISWPMIWGHWFIFKVDEEPRISFLQCAASHLPQSFRYHLRFGGCPTKLDFLFCSDFLSLWWSDLLAVLLSSHKMYVSLENNNMDNFKEIYLLLSTMFLSQSGYWQKIVSINNGYQAFRAMFLRCNWKSQTYHPINSHIRTALSVL